jgi:methylase of polypeptide subunit release factors
MTALVLPRPREVAFGGLRVLYDHTVLAPRAWTLVQSAWAAALAPTLPGGRVLELCAGVGHIGQEVAHRSDRSVLQVDSDTRACHFAALNAARNHLAHRVEVRCTDLADLSRAADASRAGSGGGASGGAGGDGDGDGERFPLILADPPYLRTGDLDTTDGDGDPRHTVDGGPDGLVLVRRVLEIVAQRLDEGGVALVQLRGRSQVDALDAADRCDLVLLDIREHDPQRAVAALIHDRAATVSDARTAGPSRRGVRLMRKARDRGVGPGAGG